MMKLKVVLLLLVLCFFIGVVLSLPHIDEDDDFAVVLEDEDVGSAEIPAPPAADIEGIQDIPVPALVMFAGDEGSTASSLSSSSASTSNTPSKYQYFLQPEGFDTMLQKNQLVRMSLSGVDGISPLGDPTYVMTNSSPILYIPGYSRFYTAGQIEKNFNYFYIEANAPSVTKLVDKIKTEEPNLAERESYLLWNSVLMKELYDMTVNISKMDNQVICLELHFDFNERSLLDTSRDLMLNRAYYCYDGGDYFYMNQDSLNVVMKSLLHVFRMLIAVGAVGWIATRAKYFNRTDFECTHITTTYYMPPYWLLLIFPSAKRFGYNLKNWILFTLLLVYALLFTACVVFGFAPNLYFPRIKSNASLFITQRDFVASNFLWYYLLLPGLFVVTFVSGVFKVRIPRGNVADLVKGYSDKKFSVSTVGKPKLEMHVNRFDLIYYMVEKGIRIVICSIIGCALASVWCSVLFTVGVISDYNEIMLLLHFGVMALAATVYMVYQSPQLIFEYLATRGYNLCCNLVSRFRRDDDRLTNLVEQLHLKRRDIAPTNGYIHFYFFYMIPTWIFESIWLSSTFLISYIVAVVIARFVWSCVLLFILFPNNLQLYILLLTMLGTFIKFFYDLNSPYQDLKNQFLTEKETLNWQRQEAKTNKVMRWNQEQVLMAYQAGMKFCVYLPMSTKDFLKVAKVAEVPYLLVQSLLRMVFTNFVLCLFFMASSLFGNASGNSSVLMKVGFATLLPFLPKLVDMFYPNTTALEKTVFKKRASFATQNIEREKCPNNSEVRRYIGRKQAAFSLFPDETLAKANPDHIKQHMAWVYQGRSYADPIVSAAKKV